MDREEEDEDDWLKMVNPPEWLRRVEVEEYDAWLPPPVRPTAPLAEVQYVLGYYGKMPLLLYP